MSHLYLPFRFCTIDKGGNEYDNIQIGLNMQLLMVTSREARNEISGLGDTLWVLDLVDLVAKGWRLVVYEIAGCRGICINVKQLRCNVSFWKY